MVSRRLSMSGPLPKVVQTLVVSAIVVVLDELADALFELSWQIVVFQQHPDFHGAMIPLDLLCVIGRYGRPRVCLLPLSSSHWRSSLAT
jgi:hypothetical protein